MKETQALSVRSTPRQAATQWTVWIVAFALLYVTIQLYTHAVMMQNQELTAVLASLCVLGGVYAGRYLTHLWTHPDKLVPNGVFLLLAGLLTVGLAWLFRQAEFYIVDRSFPNGLLLAFPLLLLSLTIGSLIKSIRLNVQHQIQSAQAQAEHSQNELQLLQSQLSPHFLFNTLNNMYGIALMEPEKTPTLLLKLSDLLRYSVYDAKESFVPLRSEIAYLRNYIDFEKLRIGEKLALDISLEGVADETLKIAPMLLTVFVENAFKHSKNTLNEEIAIQITLKLKGKSMLFWVKNSHSNEPGEAGLVNKHSGLGLANVQKRLDLLYRNAYLLTIKEQEHEYAVRLELNLK